MTSREPPFSATKPKYDLSTFTGRLMHFIDITEPSTLFYSDEKVMESKTILEKYKTTGYMCGTDSDMWAHRKLVDAAIHPISGEIIPKPFRVSAIAPVNIPIVFGMLICPASNVVGMDIYIVFKRLYLFLSYIFNRDYGFTLDKSKL